MELSADVVKHISSTKKEGEWMLKRRMDALSLFSAMPMPKFGPGLSAMKLEEIEWYSEGGGKKKSWEEVDPAIREKFEKLGVPEAERKFLAGLEAQLESEAVYGNLKKEWEGKGVIFTNMDEALQKHPELVRKYLGKAIPPSDNKFAALTDAVWSGGSFLYVPRGVKLEAPLHAYFMISKEGIGQFERTVIIAEEGSSVHYVEGCSAPLFPRSNLHTGVVEIFAEKGAHVRYTTLQNWSHNVYNLVTQRGIAKENATIEWIDGNMGSLTTMKYPTVILAGEGAKGSVLSISVASGKQNQDSGGKVVHLAPNTSSTIISKSVSSKGGVATFRASVDIKPEAKNSNSFVKCQGLMLDGISKNNSIPKFLVGNGDSFVSHEASAGRISEKKLFYLMSRGLSRKEAEELLVIGFLESFLKELPFEYAVEFNRLLQMEIEGQSV
ncbi:MAG: Fe-S cluster assembly protein SufB [Candidatus Micrarchaeia archaeon]|jgi:Fe-S cluster assembly protein SufB